MPGAMDWTSRVAFRLGGMGPPHSKAARRLQGLIGRFRLVAPHSNSFAGDIQQPATSAHGPGGVSKRNILRAGKAELVAWEGLGYEQKLFGLVKKMMMMKLNTRLT